MKWTAGVLAAMAISCAGAGGGGNAAGPGIVSGTALDAAGNPLVDAEVVILGTTFQGGEDVSFYPRTEADGTYSIEVPEGNYSVSASHTLTFDGRRYRLNLWPGDGKRGKSYPSKAGITQNFTLRLSGLRPDGEMNPDAGYSYYGGQSDFAVQDVYNESFTTSHFAAEFPEGFTARVTLTPDGPLLDGSQGQPVVFEKKVVSMYDASFNGIDIPLGKYTVAAVATKPSGDVRVLQVIRVGPYTTGALPAPAPSAPFVFMPDTTTGVKTMGAAFIYGAPYPAP